MRQDVADAAGECHSLYKALWVFSLSIAIESI